MGLLDSISSNVIRYHGKRGFHAVKFLSIPRKNSSFHMKGSLNIYMGKRKGNEKERARENRVENKNSRTLRCNVGHSTFLLDHRET